MALVCLLIWKSDVVGASRDDAEGWRRAAGARAIWNVVMIGRLDSEMMITAAWVVGVNAVQIA